MKPLNSLKWQVCYKLDGDTQELIVKAVKDFRYIESIVEIRIESITWLLINDMIKNVIFRDLQRMNLR